MRLHPTPFSLAKPSKLQPSTSTCELLMMAHLTNPLATASQLYNRSSFSNLPQDLLESIVITTQCLTQAAGHLLELPQSVTAQANVILARYWLVDSPMAHEFSVCLSCLNPHCSATSGLTSYRMLLQQPSTSSRRSANSLARLTTCPSFTHTFCRIALSSSALMIRRETTRSPTTEPSPSTSTFKIGC